MKKFVEISHQCKGEYSGCIQVSDAPSLHLCLKNPNQCFWVYDAGRHDVNLGAYPATSTVVAIERASTADMISASIEPDRGLSPTSLTRNLTAFQRLIKSGHSTELLSHPDTDHLIDIIDQMKPKRQYLDAPFEFEMIPIVIAELTKRVDIVSKALEFSILTSSRFHDIARLKWQSLDLNADHIILNFGQAIQHLVPLSESGKRLLEGLSTSSDLVFSTNEGEPISVKELQRTAQKFDPKFSSPIIRAAFKAWVVAEAGSNSQLEKIKKSGYGHKLSNGGHTYTLENLQTPEIMTSWSDFCYSRV